MLSKYIEQFDISLCIFLAVHLLLISFFPVSTSIISASCYKIFDIDHQMHHTDSFYRKIKAKLCSYSHCKANRSPGAGSQRGSNAGSYSVHIEIYLLIFFVVVLANSSLRNSKSLTYLYVTRLLFTSLTSLRINS